MASPYPKDLTGQRFNKLVVLRRVAHIHGRVAWKCQCDCGNTINVTGNSLQRNNTKSCGCLNHVKKLPDVDWNDPESRNVRRRELYVDKVAAGHKRIRTPEYYAKKAIYLKKRREENPEKVQQEDRAKSKRYRDAHPEKIAADNQKFRDENPEYGAQWYARNKETQKVYNAIYNREHPEVQIANSQRRRAAKLAAPVNDFSAAQWKEMKAAYDNRCVYCGRKMKRLSQDHITPLSKGGSHTASNILPACKSCNSKKNNKAVLKPIQPVLFLLAPSHKSRKIKK